MKVNVDGDIKEISLIYGIADNRATDWTKETIDVVSDGIKDEEGYPIIREKDFAILKKIENELKKNNEFSFYMPVFFSLQELYNKMVNENKERVSLQSNRVAKIVKAAIRKKAEEDSKKIKSVHIDSVEVEWSEGPIKDTRFQKGKKYSYEEFQSLVNKWDYQIWNKGDYFGGYDKMGGTANITIKYEDGTEEKDVFDFRIDLGDGKHSTDAISLKFRLEQAAKAPVDNADVPYNKAEYEKEFGTWESNADKYMENIKIPTFTDYSKKSIDQIGVGDIFEDDGDFFEVSKRTPSSIWVNHLNSSRLNKTIKNTREKLLEDIGYYIPGKGYENTYTVIDTSKPLRLRDYNGRVVATQGRNTLHAWDGQPVKIEYNY